MTHADELSEALEAVADLTRRKEDGIPGSVEHLNAGIMLGWWTEELARLMGANETRH